VLALLAVLAGGLVIWTNAHRGSAPPKRSIAREPQPIISPDFGPGLAAPSAAPGAVTHEGLRIRVPELKIDLPIVEGDGYDAPLYKAAHYPGMPWPGEGGRSMIYAHARPGMFGPLFGAQVGEHVEIAGEDGRTRRYVIREYYPRWPITDLKWLQPGDHEQLVLVTCTTYNYNDPRIVAVAEPA
jgi:LPXTG-site transpeptidase (sortase) family protein